MDRERIDWISAHFLAKEIKFPNETTWQLTRVLAEKTTYFDDEPAEASAVLSCIQKNGPQVGCEAIMRIRMQYEAAHRSHESSQLITVYLGSQARNPHCIRIQSIGLKKHQRRLQFMPKWRLRHLNGLQGCIALTRLSSFRWFEKSKIRQCGSRVVGSSSSSWRRSQA